MATPPFPTASVQALVVWVEVVSCLIVDPEVDVRSHVVGDDDVRRRIGGHQDPVPVTRHLVHVQVGRRALRMVASVG